MSPTDGIDLDRRRTLRALAGGVAGGGLAAVASPASGQTTALSEWFADTDNAGEVVDATGREEVTVEVGTDGNGQAFGFGPAAVRVDPGATVVWEWTGEGGRHNVVAGDDSFESDLTDEAGHTFEHAFETEGVTRYVCVPHDAMGMKGAVVVGDVDVGLGAGGSESAASDTATATASGGGGDGSDSAGSDGDSEGASGGASVDVDYGDWFDGVSNFDGTVDATGQGEVTVLVGAEGNGGNLAFEPAAVRVDPGATVVWEWTGEGGQHNVVAEDVALESPLQGDAGATYAAEVDGNGTLRYVCEPHVGAGMKGAVVVGNPTQSGGVDWLKTGLVGLAGAIVAAPFVASEVLARRRRDDGSRDSKRQLRAPD